MIEKMLSPAAHRLYIAGLILTVAYVLALLFTGRAEPLNAWQASIFDGSYYPALTFLILGLPGIILSFAAAFAYDFVMGRSNRPSNDLDPLE